MSDRLDELVDSHPLPTWRIASWPIIILVTAALVWAYYARLDEVTVATGVVVPQGDIKVIQHLEGGIIENIFVNEGSRVKLGQPLIQLDIASSGLNEEALQVQLDSQIVLKARLDAEAAGEEPVFPEDVVQRRPNLVNAQKRAYEAGKREFDSSITTVDAQIRQRELEVSELQAKKKSNERNLGLAKQRLNDSAELLKQNLVPRMEHLKLEAEVEDLESEIQTLNAAIPRAQASVEEAGARRAETIQRFRREAQDEVGLVEEQIARIEQSLKQVTERGARLEIKSPIEGIVKNMRYTTIGGVVKPGEPIMEIVPTSEKLIVDAKLDPKDVGFVTEGQPARVKISTYDFIRYGALEGKVILVAADVTESEQGPYFQVQVETDKTYLGETEGQFPITAGMQATVDIHTGSKSVMTFLVKPVLKMKSEAFRER